MDKQAILNLFKDFSFTEFSEDNAEDLIYSLPESFSFTWHSGATKLVLIPMGADYVIKIPFCGAWADMPVEDSYEDECAYKNTCPNYGSQCECCSQYEENYEEDYQYYDFENANGEGHGGWDYCETEVALYTISREKHVNGAFAKEYLLGYGGSLHDHPIYIQQRCTTYYERHSSLAEEEKDNDKSNVDKRSTLNDYCSSHNLKVMRNNIDWQYDALQFYGQKKFNRIMRFIDDYNISDLHCGNVGYLGTRPIIIDYSSFNDAR